jgi:hypothetical protein
MEIEKLREFIRRQSVIRVPFRWSWKSCSEGSILESWRGTIRRVFARLLS